MAKKGIKRGASSRLEIRLTVSNPSVEAEKTSVYQPQPQAKPNAPKFRM